MNKKKSNEEKWIQYAAKISTVINSIFDEDSDNYSIDFEELHEDNNITIFMHALANAFPTHFYNQITGDNLNMLEFNHLANSLCFQYMNKPNKKEETE